MNLRRRVDDQNLICTCSSLYREDIQNMVSIGWDDPNDIMVELGTQFRCERCLPLIENIIVKNR